MEKNNFEKIFSFEEMKIWMAQFSLAIKNEDNEKIRDLLADNEDYFFAPSLFLATDVLTNLKLNTPTESQKRIFEKSNENIFEVLDFIWQNNYHKNNTEKIYLEEKILKMLRKPIIISRISPFTLSGAFLFHLSGVEYTKYKKSAYEYCEDYSTKYKRYFNKNYGKNGEPLNVKAYLERNLHIDLNEESKGKNSDLWHLCELVDILERELFESKSESSTNQEGTRPLRHLLADYEDYYCYTDEIFKNCDMDTSKIMMFRTFLFQNLNDEEKYKLVKMQKFALEFAMNLMLKLCYLGIGEGKHLLTLRDIKKILQSGYLKNILKKDTTNFENPSDISLECFVDYRNICNQIENKYREENKKLEANNESNEKCNIFFECLWKIFLMDWLSDMKQIRNVYHLMDYNSRKNLSENYVKAIRLIDGIHEQGKFARQEDKEYFFEKYSAEIWSKIFPKITEKDFCKLWDISCRVYVLVNSDFFNVEFEKIRLLNKTEKKPSKKFPISSELQFDIVQLSTIMEVVDFSRNIACNEVAGVKKFGYKILKKNFFHILENISKYSSDTVITAVQRMILYQIGYRQSIMAEMPFQSNAPIYILLKVIDILEQSVKSLKSSRITIKVLEDTTKNLLQILENELGKLNQSPLVLLYDQVDKEIEK